MEEKKFTNSVGAPVENDQASISTGIPGPTLMQDVHLIEKLAHFDHERIPERVVHAKGTGAFGYFEVTHDVSKYTDAAFLNGIGKKTEVFVRFSTVGGERGSADAARDPRGFAVKFYTEEGNYDLTGNNTPIFFIRDAIKFPDFIHTQKRLPNSNLKSDDMMWDFWSLTPESLHQVFFLFTDRGTPKNYRHMHGFGSHTFMWYKRDGSYYWVKYHWRCDQGIENLTAQEAMELSGRDPDHATRDLFESIQKGDYPSWRLEVQIMTPEQAKEYRFDPFDVTKVWYHKDFPLMSVGKMVLNKNPENFFAEVEQAAFSPANFVPGIGPSPDKLLQGRLFSYTDTQRHRLGVNFNQIPVNSPKGVKVANYQRDGAMAVNDNGGSDPNYYPNTKGGPDYSKDAFGPPAIDVNGTIARHKPELTDIDFEQPGELLRRVLSEQDKEHLVSNIVGSLKNARQNVQYRQCALFYKAESELAKRVNEKLSLDFDKIVELSKMSQEDRVKNTK
jgi:catalase